MFEQIYNLTIQSTSFEELESKLISMRHDIDASAHKNNFYSTVAGHLALEGRHDQVEWLQQLGANINEITRGYVQAGNHQKVHEYVTRYPKNATDIAMWYVLAGNYEQVDNYIENYKANVDRVIEACVIARDYDTVESYRQKYNIDVSKMANLCARTGDFEMVEFYRLKHGAKVNAIIEGYALSRYHQLQKKYDIHLLLKNYLEERSSVVDASGSTKEYFYNFSGGFFYKFQKSFTEKRRAVKALQAALKGEIVDLHEHLSTLRNGRLGKELRAFVKMGLADVFVDKKVTTVSEFVEALQAKNELLPKQLP